jgi:hypothetical protein
MKKAKRAVFERLPNNKIKLTVERETETREVVFNGTMLYFLVGNFKVGFMEMYHDNRTDLIKKIIVEAVNDDIVIVEISRGDETFKYEVEQEFIYKQYPTTLKIVKINQED